MIDLLNHIPLAGLMLVVATGYGLGRLAWRGLALGPAGGTLLLALLLGAAGLEIDLALDAGSQHVTVGAFGFALFIYSVGFEAGPRFMSSLLGGPGWRFVVIAVAVNAFAVGIALLWGALTGLNDALTAGLLSGALTSAPTYAAAQHVTSDPAALSVVFAVTYPLGLCALVLLVQLLPKRFGQDLAASAHIVEAQRSPGEDSVGPELTRVFEVVHEAVTGKALSELDLSHATGCWITAIHRGSRFEEPKRDTALELGDHVMARGRLDELRRLAERLGPEVYDENLRQRMPSPRQIVVTEVNAIGQRLEGIALPQRFGCMVLEVRRGQVTLEPHAHLTLERGDVLRVVGPRGKVREAAETLGRLEVATAETNIAVYAGGIVLGLLLGHFAVPCFGLRLTLGTAGGLLLAGILLGRFRTLGPVSTHVPVQARQLVRDLGILLFVAEAGVRAGQSPLGDVKASLLPVLGGTLAVTAGALVATLIAVRLAFPRMPSVHVWGSVGGGMTSSAALTIVRRASDESNEPALSYAAAYAVASVLVTLAGQLIVFWMR